MSFSLIPFMLIPYLRNWASYIYSSLAFMMSSNFSGSLQAIHSLTSRTNSTGIPRYISFSLNVYSSEWVILSSSLLSSPSISFPSSNTLSKGLKGLKILVGSIGSLKLGHMGGVSSSAALTGGFVLGFNHLLNIGLSKLQLAQTDFSE